MSEFAEAEEPPVEVAGTVDELARRIAAVMEPAYEQGPLQRSDWVVLLLVTVVLPIVLVVWGVSL